MTLRRAAVIGLGLSFAFAAQAMAQGAFGPPPPGFGPPSMQSAAPPPGSPPPGAAPPPGAPPGGPPCMNDFVPLRQEAEKRAGAIKVAAQHKAERSEICKLITRFSEAEAKFAQYLEKNQTWCGIPAQIVAQVKTNHAKTMKTRAQVCSNSGPMGAQGPNIPPGPGLSDVLGTSRVPSASNTSTGKGGTFDTLSGNPIK
jgi:hypothetical protein